MTDEILSRVAEACRRAGWVRLAVAFGSQVTGRARPDSDFDLGVTLTREVSLAEELALASEISKITGTEVDLVRLDLCDPLLKREVARSGVPVHAQAPGDLAAWRAAAMSEWLDFDETIAPHRERFLKRLAGT